MHFAFPARQGSAIRNSVNDIIIEKQRSTKWKLSIETFMKKFIESLVAQTSLNTKKDPYEFRFFWHFQTIGRSHRKNPDKKMNNILCCLKARKKTWIRMLIKVFQKQEIEFSREKDCKSFKSFERSIIFDSENFSLLFRKRKKELDCLKYKGRAIIFKIEEQFVKKPKKDHW